MPHGLFPPHGLLFLHACPQPLLYHKLGLLSSPLRFCLNDGEGCFLFGWRNRLDHVISGVRADHLFSRTHVSVIRSRDRFYEVAIRGWDDFLHSIQRFRSNDRRLCHSRGGNTPGLLMFLRFFSFFLFLLPFLSRAITELSGSVLGALCWGSYGKRRGSTIHTHVHV